MSNPLELLAENRTDSGKGASRRLRREGKVPAILYGGDREPRALSLDHDALIHQLENEAFYSSILTVTVADASQPCILKDLHRHPAKNAILHVDLQRVLDDVEIPALAQADAHDPVVVNCHRIRVAELEEEGAEPIEGVAAAPPAEDEGSEEREED